MALPRHRDDHHVRSAPRPPRSSHPDQRASGTVGCELTRRLLRPLRLARTEHDRVTGEREPPRQPTTLVAGTAQERQRQARHRRLPVLRSPILHRRAPNSGPAIVAGVTEPHRDRLRFTAGSPASTANHPLQHRSVCEGGPRCGVRAAMARLVTHAGIRRDRCMTQARRAAGRRPAAAPDAYRRPLGGGGGVARPTSPRSRATSSAPTSVEVRRLAERPIDPRGDRSPRARRRALLALPAIPLVGALAITGAAALGGGRASRTGAAASRSFVALGRDSSRRSSRPRPRRCTSSSASWPPTTGSEQVVAVAGSPASPADRAHRDRARTTRSSSARSPACWRSSNSCSSRIIAAKARRSHFAASRHRQRLARRSRRSDDRPDPTAPTLLDHADDDRDDDDPTPKRTPVNTSKPSPSTTPTNVVATPPITVAFIDITSRPPPSSSDHLTTPLLGTGLLSNGL